MNNWNRFDETELPSKKQYYSKLRLEHITDEECEHAKRLWNLFNIKNIGEYHDLYVQSDTAQLTDVFENFRNICLKEYELDPTYFASTPRLAIEAMLKMTGVKIELLTDINMVLIIENTIRGGLTQVVRKYAVANNKYLPEYDKNRLSSYLQYLDANNLYGYAMIRKLPLNNFKWSAPNKFTSEFIKNFDENKSNKGYLLEVDIEYPKKVHKEHEGLPFLLEQRKPLEKMYEHKVTDQIKKFHYKVYRQFNITHEFENKLIATIQDKQRHALTISTLKQALDHGLILKQVHRVI